MRIFFILVLSILFISSAQAASFVVENVIDGDTLKLTNGEVVHLLGIDVPENNPNEKAKRLAERRNIDISDVLYPGRKAALFVNKMLEGKEVRLEYDVDHRDNEGNLQAYVYIPVCFWRTNQPNCKSEAIAGYIYVVLPSGPQEHGKYVFVNATIILSGYAMPMSLAPNTRYAEEFKNLFEIAQKNKMGLWH